MSDDVKVTLKVTDWYFVPNRTHEKTIEFDREDWNEMTPESRKHEIDESLREFIAERFEQDYEVHGADVNDPTL